MTRLAVTGLAIIGATGRMGRALIRLAPEFPDLAVTAAVASTGSAELGRDCGELAGVGSSGVRIASDLAAALAGADVAIDFSSAHAVRANLAAARRAHKPLLIGTTGYDNTDLAGEFDQAAREIPLLVAANTSLGVTVLIELVREAARALPAAGFDIEIIEAHHRMKKDAPSGTALALGRAAAEGRERAFEEDTAPGSADPRPTGRIGFASVRGGDIVGDHTVLFAGTGERLALSHHATDRAIFARGALQAAAWLAARPAGRYFMRDLVTEKSGG
jgi:4-hydroxy-tetrahydrodipicolinate reductase